MFRRRKRMGGRGITANKAEKMSDGSKARKGRDRGA